MVNYGVARARELIEAIDKPAIMLTGTTMPRLTGEIGFAGGYSGYLGSGIAYTTSYIKELSIEDGIRNYQYLDRLAAMYHEHGVELHRRQPGFLTGTNIPPCIAIVDLRARLPARRRAGRAELRARDGRDAAPGPGRRGDRRLRRAVPGVPARRRAIADVFTPVTLLHWMSAWPHDEAQAAALVSYGGTLAAISGAASVTTKSDARGVRHSDAAGQRRGPAHDAHGDLPRARHPPRRAAGIRAREGADRARGARDRRQGAGDGRRRRRGRHGARVRGGRAWTCRGRRTGIARAA